LSFLDNLDVNGIKAQHDGYTPVEPRVVVASGGREYEMRGYVSAVMSKAGSDHRRIQAYRIHMDFYFGPGEGLESYKLLTLGDW
jgi:hypothetical protein